MPGFIAWLYVYGQSVKAAGLEGTFIRWNEEGFRQQYYDRFVSGVDDLVQIVEEEAPLVTVFDSPDPEPGTGSNYTPEAPKRGKPVKTQ